MTERTLDYALSWEGEAKGGAEKATWGRLSIGLGDECLWGTADKSGVQGVRWTWVDLLDHLAEIWPWLLWEDGWPAGPRVRDSRNFLSDAQRWLEDLAEDDANAQEELLHQYRHRHDLAMAIRGKLLPQLWVVREGNNAWVAGKSSAALLSHGEVLAVLERIGDQIAARLKSLDDERSTGAVEAWTQRFAVGTSLAAAISVGVTSAELAELAGGDVAAAFEIDTAESAEQFEPNELLAAARMAVPSTDGSVVRAILAVMKNVAPCVTPELDALSDEAEAHLAKQSGRALKPHVLGRELARWLREWLGISRDQRVEPDQLLEQWGVFLGELSAEDDGIEAVACWGKAHGPAILVNPQGRHSQDEPGRRATLAHEIAHLLVDRRASLPLAEVFGGHVSLPVEQRARAFAAELLMPMEIAGAAFRDTSTPRQVLDALGAEYGASREIIAWQAYNSGHGMNWDTFIELRKHVRPFKRFDWNVASGKTA